MLRVVGCSEEMLLYHINKVDDAIIDCTVYLEALLQNLRNGIPR
jgi:hypothetical protein